MSPKDETAAFYDEHPYPPAVDDLDHVVAAWQDPTRRRIEHFRHWPTLPFRKDPTILVAGCGTFQAASWGIRYPLATVVGIDVSPASLDATRRLLRHHRIENVALEQLPIESVGDLGRSFDQVVCTGVLHHLRDPVAGLRSLRDVLTPHGALNLMVYARYGRLGIAMLQEYCRRLGLRPVPGEIEDLLGVLGELPMGHPMSHVLRDTPDFRDPGAVADALLNPRELSYTVPELFELLAAARVRFVRWVRQAPYKPQCGIMSELSHSRRMTELDEVDQYSLMELFRGTISRHSLVAYRDDSPLPDLEWQEGKWDSYIPIVPTTAMVVRERLPPGKAAALINRAHVDNDLVCFLGEDELEVFEAFDGSTRLGAIPGATGRLIERLWMHDLLMIDASAN